MEFAGQLSAVPIDVLTRLNTSEELEDLAMLRTFRFVRLIRLVKLLRVLRASRIIARWQNFIGLSYAQLTMIKARHRVHTDTAPALPHLI